MQLWPKGSKSYARLTPEPIFHAKNIDEQMQ